jgi:hypothetical protein
VFLHLKSVIFHLLVPEQDFEGPSHAQSGVFTHGNKSSGTTGQRKELACDFKFASSLPAVVLNSLSTSSSDMFAVSGTK